MKTCRMSGLFLLAMSLCLSPGSSPGLARAGGPIGETLRSPSRLQEPEQEPEQEEDLDIDALMEQAQSLIDDGKFGDAAEIYRRITRANEELAPAWQLLGYCLHVSGKLDEAIEAHKRAASFTGSGDAEFRRLGLYNLGCAYSLKKEPDQAFEYLHQAVDAGFRDSSLLAEDADLESLRADPRFAEVVDRVKSGGARKFDPASLVGTWKLLSGEKAGEAIAAEATATLIEMTATEFRIPVPGADEGFVMSYRIDAAKKPMQIDMEITAGPAPPSKAPGIIEIKDGQLTLCYDPTGEKRPETFATSEENGCFLFRMKMEPKADKAAPAGKGDAAMLVGKWSVISGQRAGEEVSEDRLNVPITVDAKTITIPAGNDSFVMSYELDLTASPIAIDMEVVSGPAPAGSVAIGIVERTNDGFRLCYQPMGGDRPERFESTAENGCFLFVVKADK